MRRYTVFFILIWLIWPIVTLAQSNSSTSTEPSERRECPLDGDTRAIRQAAQEFKNAYNAGDPDKIASLYAENAIYMTQHFAKGIIEGRKDIRTYFKLGTDAGFKVDSIDILALDCTGEMAYVVTRYQSTNAGQKAFGHNVVVSKKIGGNWLIVVHESAVPEPTAIQKLE